MSAAWALCLAAALPAADAMDLLAPAASTRAVTPSAALFHQAWHVPVVRHGLDRTVPLSFGAPAIAAAQRRIVVGTGEGDVVAFGLDDGREIWRVAGNVPFEAAPALVATPVGTLAVLGGRDGRLVAFDVASGAQAWHADLGGEARAAPRVVGNRLLVTTAANQVFMVAASTGEVCWQNGRAAPTGLTVEGHARAAVADGRVFATFSDGYAMALDAATGETVWARPLSLSAQPFLDADADPVVGGDTVYVASYADGIYALDVADGRTRWNRPAPAVTALAAGPTGPAGQQTLIVGSADGLLWGLRARDGSVRWRTRAERGAISRLTVHGGLAIFSAGSVGLVAVDARDGRPVAASGLGGRPAGDPAWADGAVSVLSAGGTLHTFWVGAPT